MPSDITYQREPDLTTVEFADVLRRSGLSERRPVDDEARLDGMLQHANLIITARDAPGLLIGVSRALTDFHYCTYLSDLAVDAACQGHGIGRALIDETHRTASLQTTLILLAAPDAESYYPHIGMQKHHSCWIVQGQKKVIERGELG